jgi:hypothetical protein
VAAPRPVEPRPKPPCIVVAVLPLFGLTIFLSAALLFIVQPMIAKMVLPLLGGSPAVWNTCMVFFQAALLGGYAYAHWSTRALGIRRQAMVHCIVVLAPLAMLPIAIRTGSPPPGENPIPWVLWTLLLAVGLPFFVASTTGPLMQRWFAATQHRAAADPYFLYAASNAGSLLALLAYPLAMEPTSTIRQQCLLWTGGYIALAVLIIACAVAVVRREPRDAKPIENETPATEKPRGRELLIQRARWVFLAFIPSSLMLGATQFISTDVAAVPLLWVIPLAIYLLTFIFAFGTRRAFKTRNLSDILAIVLSSLAIIFLVRGEYHLPVWALFLLHLAAFFVAAMFCHSRLADLRPPVGRLTEFYLLLALGGVLGGAFNALLAPVLFAGVIEYPIALVAAAFMRLPGKRDWFRKYPAWLGITIDITAAILIAGMVLAFSELAYDYGIRNVGVRLGLTVGIPALCVFLLAPRVRGFALGLAALLGIGMILPEGDGRLIHQERTFFGVYRVYRAGEELNPAGAITSLVHGTTVHGAQFIDPTKASTPLTYYHPDGPIGEVFKLLGPSPALDRVGLIGLGSGALCAYGRPGQTMVFHEIDPAVIRIATDPQYFSYITTSKAAIEFVPGDGRLTLADVPDGSYGLLVLDAFSSDAIPVHLITKEAVALYARKIRADGLIAFHISNQYIDLGPILARISEALDLKAFVWLDAVEPKVTDRTMRFSSDWVLLTTDLKNLGPLAGKGHWLPLRPKPNDPLWTDSYSDLISVFEFR